MGKVSLLKKIISLTLIVTLLASMIPSEVMANETTKPEYSNSVIEPEYTTGGNEPYGNSFSPDLSEVTDNIAYQTIDDTSVGMQEDETKRTEYSKTFELGNNRYYVALYSEPVHFIKDGEWDEIDSSLTEDKKNGKTIFKNNHAPFQIEFSGSDEQEGLATLSKDGYTVSWDISECNINAKSGRATRTEKRKITKNKIKVNQPFSLDSIDKTVLKNKVSAISYKDAFTNTDLKYTVSSNRVKEDIILKDKKDITDYSMDLKTSLNATLNDDNSIHLTNDNGEIIFVIQAPYMYDSNNASSTDILLALNKTSSGWQILIAPSREWLQDEARVWPVTIDPSFYNDETHVWDTYATPGGTVDHRNNEKMYIGNYSGKLCRSYIKYLDLTQDKTGVDIGAGSIINSATLKLFLNPQTSTWGNINLYRINDTFVQGMPDSNKVKNVTSLVTNVAPSSLVYTMNVTNTVQQWYDGTVANNGFMIRYNNESLSDYNAIMTSENDQASLRPSLTFTYTRDTTPPTVPSISLSWTGASQNSKVVINSISGSTDSGAGVNYYQYKLNSGSWTKFTDKPSLTLNEGVNTILARAIDKAGNISTAKSTTVRKDTISPTVPTAIALSWTGASKNATVNINSISGSTDSGSGVAYYQYQLNGGSWIKLSGTATLSLIEGENTIAARAVDNVGKNSETYPVKVRKDTIAPSVPKSIDLSWKGASQNSTVTINSISGSTDSGSGVAYYQYQLNGGAWTKFNGATTLTVIEGENTIAARAVDNAGNNSNALTESIKKDTIAPSIPTSIDLSWTGASQNAAVTIKGISGSTDVNGSGVAYYQYQFNGGAWTKFTAAIELQLNEGENTIAARSMDNVGKPSESYTVKVRKDTIAPTKPTSIDLSWTGASQNATVNINGISGSTDSGSGVAYYQYQLNSGAWTKLSGTPTLTLVEGENIIAARSVDYAGNTSESYPIKVRKDTTAPSAPTSIALSWTGASQNASVTINGISGSTDVNGSGVAYYQYQLNNGTWTTLTGTPSLNLVEGSNTIAARSVDYVGKPSVPYSVQVKKDTTAPTITLSSSTTWATSSKINSAITDSNSGIVLSSIKWAYGSFTKTNFPAGIAFDGTSFEAKANGIYTVYAKDNCGNAAVQTISVANIYSAPSLGNFSYSTTDFSVDSPGFTMDFTRTYNSFHNSVGLFGKGWSFHYQGQCKDYTYSYQDANGNTQTASLPNLKIVTMPDGNNFYFELNGSNYIGKNTRSTLIKNSDNTYTLTDTDRNSYHFTIYGYMDSITDRNGNKVTITVDSAGKLTKITDSVGRVYTLLYNSDGKVASITDPAGRVFSYTYKDGNILASISPTGKTMEGYEYNDPNPTNYLTTIKDALGNKIQEVTYSQSGKKRLNSNTDKDKKTYSYQYDDSANSVEITDPDGNRVITTYDQFSRPITTSDGTEVTGTTSYLNQYNEVDITTIPGENTTDYDYYSDGNIKSIIVKDDEGNTIEENTYTYTMSSGNITKCIETRKSTSIDDEGGSITTTTTITTDYDSKGNMLSEKEYDGAKTVTTSYTYKSNGQINTETSSDNTVTSYVYDSYGYPKTISVQASNTDGSTTNVITEYDYNAIGFLLTATAPNGTRADYIYNQSGDVIKQTVGEGTNKRILRITYDSRGRMKQRISPGEYSQSDDQISVVGNGIASSESYKENIGSSYTYYDDSEKIKSVHVSSYDIMMDKEGNITAANAAGKNLASYTYKSDKFLENVNYANGATIEYGYNGQESISTIKIDGVERYSYTYDEDGTTLKSMKDQVSNTTTEYAANPDDGSTMVTLKDSNNQVINRYTISSDSSTFTDSVNGSTYGLKSDSDGKIDKFLTGMTEIYQKSYQEDTKSSTSTISNGSLNLFKADSRFNTSGQIVEHMNTYTNGSDQLSYTYDPFGNIETISKNGVKQYHYYYDISDQLIRVDDVVQNNTFTYTYDKKGNILQKKVYAYATGDLTHVELKDTIDYGYGASAYPDQALTSYDGKSITYDSLGNPLNYLGWTMSWTAGRELEAMTKGSDRYSYTYDDKGIRTSKTVNGKVTKYTTIEGRITSQNDGTHALYFRYDKDNQLTGVNVDGVEYLYAFNAQGDVTNILDTSGNAVVSYGYDAWGKGTVVSDSTNVSLGTINPMRYRGYYYDDESGLYYLQSRYYDPNTFRFINADEPSMLGLSASNPIGANLCAYSNNNPVMNIDPTGYFGTPIQWVCAVIGGIAGWYFGDYVAKKLGLFDGRWWQWQTYAYWTVRSLVVVGGAVFGYVAGTALLKICTKYLSANPKIMAKIPFWIKWFLGMNGGKIVIGETMSRVIRYAELIGAETYSGFKYYDKIKNMFGENIANILGKADNALWLINKMSQQYRIEDIGIEVGRASRSSSYIMESIIVWLTRYKNTVKIFFK